MATELRTSIYSITSSSIFSAPSSTSGKHPNKRACSRTSSYENFNFILPPKIFEDGAEAITYKDGFVDGKPPTEMCGIINYEII